MQQHERAKMAPPHMLTRPQLPPSHGRVLWNNAMVTCLLELRLGLLLPRFAAGGSSSQLKDAWTTLQLKFVLATDVNLSVQQLKNKYQQLKREYTQTKEALEKRRRLVEHAVAAVAAATGDDNEREDDGDATEDDVEDENQGEILLPGYWDIVDKAFGDAEGYDGVDLRYRSSSTSDSAKKRLQKRDRDYRFNREVAATMEEDDQDEHSESASPSHADATRRRSRAEEDDEEVASDASASRAQHPPPRSPRADNARPSVQMRSGAAPPAPSSLHESHQALAPPPPPAYARMHYAPPPQPPGYHPPYAQNNNAQYQHPRPMMNSRPVSDPNASAKKRKIDFAYALVSVGEMVANAMVESARIMAGATRGPPNPTISHDPVQGERAEAERQGGSGAAASADLAAKMDTQIQNQVLMLKMLERSNQINEELLQFLRKNNNSEQSE